MNNPALSLCLVVKNEAHQILDCLDSVRSLAPELIVVDTGSTDNTPELARSAGAWVIPFDFIPVDFSAARNLAMRHAAGRWILVLDADETVEPASLSELSSILARDENAGYYFERINHGFDSDNIDYAVRLLPNRHDYCYQGRVHETIDRSILQSGGRLLRSGVRIHHRFVTDQDSRRRKNCFYIQILKEEIAADPADDSRLDFLAAEYHQLGMFDEATAVAEEIARRRPFDAQAHLFAGTYHLLFKPDFQQARCDFDTALALKPGYLEAQSFLRLLNQKERETDVTDECPKSPKTRCAGPDQR